MHPGPALIQRILLIRKENQHSSYYSAHELNPYALKVHRFKTLGMKFLLSANIQVGSRQ
jgi:hypothetical protein